MSETRETGRSGSEELEKIDLTNLMLDFLHGVKKLWWLVVLLAVLGALQAYFNVSTHYSPRYVASATMAVRSMGTESSYINEESAKQMAEVFPYILTSGLLKDAVAEDLGLDYVPGTITASAEEGTNFFTLSVTAGDGQTAYDILQSAIANYPQVAKFVIGETKLDILDETGVPEDTGREVTIRGSYRRGAMRGAAAGLLILLLYVLTRRTVKSRKELKRYLNLEDCGSIPFVAEKKRRKKKAKLRSLLLTDERIPQGYLEAVRKLRIKVMKDMEERGHQTLLVTSSIPGEGKTTLAINLALAMARQGKRVVLVDCDPRNPSVAGYMNETGEHPGLGEVIRSKVNPVAALKRVDVEGGMLEVLFGGKASDKDARVLGSKGMKGLIDALKERADLVILDTAPADLLADASALARYVDAALYVVKYDHAKLRQIRGGIQALSYSGIHILGYVFNADKSARGRSYGYGYSSYGYKQYGSYGHYGHYGHYGRYSGKGPTADASGRVRKE